jgi:hypothetical protein
MPPTPTPTPTNAQFTTWDLGGCNCFLCKLFPCGLDAVNLHVSWHNVGLGTVSDTLTYSNCNWNSPCMANGAGSASFAMGISFGCVAYIATYWANGSCSGPSFASWYYDHPVSCLHGGSPPPSLTLTSFTCNPLNIVLTSPSNINTFTITP